MPKESPEIRLIRETLEGVLHPSTASTLFFEALQASGGALPSTAREALDLTNGPIRTALVERLGEEDATPVLNQLCMMLASADRQVRKKPSRHDEVTRPFSISDHTLPVFILTSSNRFAQTLQAVLGPDIMTPVQILDLDMLRSRMRDIAPGFVLIDASEFPAIEPADLARELASVDRAIVRALWGADLPYGQSVMDAVQQRGYSVTPFDRAEGVEPLMDVIRSRHA